MLASLAFRWQSSLGLTLSLKKMVAITSKKISLKKSKDWLICQKLSNGETSSEEIEENNAFINAKAKILAFKEQRSESKTAKLWFQHMETVELLCRFINAERSGNWQQHLQAIRDMLPYFAESGHLLYATSAYLYLQSMMKLPETHPSVYKQLQHGLHIVRRNDCFWAGPS